MAAGRFLNTLRVVATPGNRQRGLILAGTTTIPCALGRAGITRTKREGDGAAPAGTFGLTAVLYRTDRGPRPATGLPVTAIARNSGWCDDPGARAYNRPVELPYPASAENMWRDDRLYDVVVVIDFNLDHPHSGAGSAIFLHIATPDFSPTAGCVAVSPGAMRRLLPRLGPSTVIDIR